ncbi:MAG: metallophosphoesterase family protein [Ignavibacteria bacterium]|nr:metallophosphoesterase family protein [Ignavibacteria bacterium]
MRLAIISDIHGNLEALTAALELIDSRGVDEIICLGDVVGYGANPNECLDLIRQRCMVILLGNHDAAAVDLSIANSFTMNARLSALWTRQALLDKNREFLQSLPYTKERGEIFLTHGSPYNPDEWNYIITDFDARDAFQSFTHRICFVGHSHIPALFSESGGSPNLTIRDRYIINVGSIGQPRDGNPKLSFGLFDTEAWTYENIRADYDVFTAAEKINSAGLPPALAHRLMVGV